MTLRVLTPPTALPVTVADVEVHLAIVPAETDLLRIEGFIAAATEAVEAFWGRALMPRTLALSFDGYFRATVISLPLPPLVSVEAVKYIDLAGIEQTLDASAYQVSTASAPGRIAPAWGTTWPDTRNVMDAATIEYTAGHADGAAAIPARAREAILQLTGWLFENREGAADLPKAVQRLLEPARIRQP